MARIAIYVQEEPGRGDLASLDHQVRRLATQVARRPGWWAVATYADRWRPGAPIGPDCPDSSPTPPAVRSIWGR